VVIVPDIGRPRRNAGPSVAFTPELGPLLKDEKCHDHDRLRSVHGRRTRRRTGGAESAALCGHDPRGRLSDSLGRRRAAGRLVPAGGWNCSRRGSIWGRGRREERGERRGMTKGRKAEGGRRKRKTGVIGLFPLLSPLSSLLPRQNHHDRAASPFKAARSSPAAESDGDY